MSPADSHRNGAAYASAFLIAPRAALLEHF